MKHQLLLILDFGGQDNQLTARAEAFISTGRVTSENNVAKAIIPIPNQKIYIEVTIPTISTRKTHLLVAMIIGAIALLTLNGAYPLACCTA